ncbi:unnamed protein product, partial [Ranitomeya imitator]
MFTLVTGDLGIVGRWRAVCVTALQRPNSDAAAIRIVVGIAAASLSVTKSLHDEITVKHSEENFKEDGFLNTKKLKVPIQNTLLGNEEKIVFANEKLLLESKQDVPFHGKKLEVTSNDLISEGREMLEYLSMLGSDSDPDPRYRNNLQSLITLLNRECKMWEYQDTLVHSIIFSPVQPRAVLLVLYKAAQCVEAVEEALHKEGAEAVPQHK